MSPAPRLPCPWTCPFEEERGGPPAAGHCIFLQAPTGTDGSFYILSSSISCLTVSTVFYSLEYFILAFFWLFLIPSSLPCTSCVHCSRYQTFYERSPLRIWATLIPNQSVWSFKAVCSGLPVLDRSVCDCKYFPDDAARSSGLLVETDSSHDWNLTVLLQPKKDKNGKRKQQELTRRQCFVSVTSTGYQLYFKQF